MRRTPLYEEHVKLGAKMVEFAGWEMPLNYPAGIIAEHLAVRKYGGLFDISHMGRFLVTGKGALPFLQYVLTSNVAALEPGQSQYTIIPDNRGGAIDDAYLYRMTEEEYLLVVNAANTEKDWQWLQNFCPRLADVSLEDVTQKIAMLALQGPHTKEVLQAVIGRAKLPDPGRNHLTTVVFSGINVPVARTGYTGEPVGFELFPPAEIAVQLWRALLAAGSKEGIMPVGLGARDTLRLEAGLPLYGHELGTDADGRVIPILALPVARFALSFSRVKGDFIGREALLEQLRELIARQQGCLDKPKDKLLVPRMVMPLAVSGGTIARAGNEVYLNDKKVGAVTSGTVVPYWKMEGGGIKSRPGAESGKRAICLAYLDADLKAGQKTKIIVRDKTTEGIIVERHLASEAAPYAHPLLAGEAVSIEFSGEEQEFAVKARDLVKKACQNTLWRQERTINLIPSENTASPIVRLLTIADPSGRYAEHRRFKALGDVEAYYYQGTGFIAEVEAALKEELKKFLGCSEVEVRLISGQMANVTTFSGIMDYINRVNRKIEPRRLCCVMNHHIGKGGHLSAQPMGGLRDFVAVDPVTERWAVVNFPVRADNPYQTDLAETAKLIEHYKPELIVLGKSMIIHREPVKETARMISGMKPKPILMYDAAHVLGLFGPYFQEPLKEGADIVTASTHKTFFGTQRGIVASNMSEGTDYYDLWQSITRRAFPGSVSNHHLGTLLGLLMATYEMNTDGRDYQEQVIANAKAFALALKEQGLQVEGDPSIGYTETHQVLLRVGYAKAIDAADRLEKNNIIVNYQGLPDDEAFTSSSGIRMGVQEMTRFGMKEKDFTRVAELIARVVLEGKNVAEEAVELRQGFTKMRYCLPEEEAEPLVEELIASVAR
jgi:aminomethyltransferase